MHACTHSEYLDTDNRHALRNDGAQDLTDCLLLVFTCIDSNYEMQSFYYGQSCTGTPYSAYNTSIATSAAACSYASMSPSYYQRTYCSALNYTAPPSTAPTSLPTRRTLSAPSAHPSHVPSLAAGAPVTGKPDRGRSGGAVATAGQPVVSSV